MKVLTIKEPYASLIKTGKKHIETRSWKTNYRGEIYIHASKTIMKKDERVIKLLNEITPMPGFIICKAILKDCIYMDENFLKKMDNNPEEKYVGKYEIGRYAWVLDNVDIIEPIATNGKLGIWNYREDEENE